MATKANKGKGKEKTGQGSMASRPTPTRISSRIAAQKQNTTNQGKKEEKHIDNTTTVQDLEETTPMEEEEFSSAFSTPSPSRNHSPTPSEENQATPKANKKRKKISIPIITTPTSISTTTSPEIKALPPLLFPLDDTLGNHSLLEKFDQHNTENPFHFEPNTTFHRPSLNKAVPTHTKPPQQPPTQPNPSLNQAVPSTSKPLTQPNQSLNQAMSSSSKPPYQFNTQPIQATEQAKASPHHGINPIQIETPPEFQLWIKFNDIQGTSLTEKYQKIREYFTNIKGFHNVIAPRKTKEMFKLIFTSEEAIKKAKEKAILLKITTSELHPIQHDQADRTIIIKEVPLGISKEEIRANFEEYGEIEEITWSLVGLWEKAHITYKSATSLTGVDSQWSAMIGKDSVRIVTATKTAEKLKMRARFTLKLTQLPQGTTAYDIWTYIRTLGGMTCKIPRTTPHYNRQKYAIVEFSTQEEKDKALQDQPIFKGKTLIWIEPAIRTCHICGDPNHISTHCKQKKPTKQDISKDRRITTLAGIYQKQHVAISTPVGFGGIRWADILKAKPNRPTTSINTKKPEQEHKSEVSSLKKIETRLDQLEAMIKSIMEHLNTKSPERKHPQTTTQTTIEEEESQVANDTNPETYQPPNDNMDEDLNILKITTSIEGNPQQTIDQVKQNYSTPEDQVEALSQVIHTIHQTTTSRIQQLESTMEELIKKFSN